MNSLRDVVIDAHSSGRDPRELLSSISPNAFSSPEAQTATDGEIWCYLYNLACIVDSKRNSRPRIVDIDEVVDTIERSHNIVVIIGAGASVGPDFRSKGGLYDQIAESGLLEDPYDVFDLDKFREDPSIFWSFAHTIFPSRVPQHSAVHYFLAKLEESGRLLRVYSQNVDTLEVGIPDDKLICVHGSWRESYCLECGQVFDPEDLRPFVESQTTPTCPCGGKIKPGIVFFGQATNLDDDKLDYDSENADLLIVIGTSLRVAPVSSLPRRLSQIPALLINRESVPCTFSTELLGDCDDVVGLIEQKLGWGDPQAKFDMYFDEPNRFHISSHPLHAETTRGTFTISCLTSPNM